MAAIPIGHVNGAKPSKWREAESELTWAPSTSDVLLGKVYSFTTAAVTNRHKRGGLKADEFILLQFRRSQARSLSHSAGVGVGQGWPLGKLQGCPSLFPLPEAPAALGLWRLLCPPGVSLQPPPRPPLIPWPSPLLWSHFPLPFSYKDP